MWLDASSSFNSKKYKENATHCCQTYYVFMTIKSRLIKITAHELWNASSKLCVNIWHCTALHHTVSRDLQTTSPAQLASRILALCYGMPCVNSAKEQLIQPPRCPIQECLITRLSSPLVDVLVQCTGSAPGLFMVVIKLWGLSKSPTSPGISSKKWR